MEKEGTAEKVVSKVKEAEDAKDAVEGAIEGQPSQRKIRLNR